MADPSEDVRMELARRVADRVDGIADGVAAQRSIMDTMAGQVAETHSNALITKETMSDLKENSKQTATGILRLADLAEQRADLEAEDRTANREASAQRFAWFSENWKIIAVLAAAVFAPQMFPQVLGLMGVSAPSQVVYQAPPPHVDPEATEPYDGPRLSHHLSASK